MANKPNQNQRILIGAAIAAGVIGTLSTILLPRRSRKDWKSQAKDIANNVLGELSEWNPKKGPMTKNFFIGSVAGSLLGATTALLFAPKAGNDLIRDLTEALPFDHQGEGGGRPSSRSVSRSNNSRRVVRHAAAANRVQRAKSSNDGQGSSRKQANKRSSSSKAKA